MVAVSGLLVSAVSHCVDVTVGLFSILLFRFVLEEMWMEEVVEGRISKDILDSGTGSSGQERFDSKPERSVRKEKTVNKLRPGLESQSKKLQAKRSPGLTSPSRPGRQLCAKQRAQLRNFVYFLGCKWMDACTAQTTTRAVARMNLSAASRRPGRSGSSQGRRLSHRSVKPAHRGPCSTVVQLMDKGNPVMMSQRRDDTPLTRWFASSNERGSHGRLRTFWALAEVTCR